VPPNPTEKGLNWEEDGRLKRLYRYDELAGPEAQYRFVFTAHHRDDVAETVFFRFLRGEFDVQRKGVLFQDSQMLRPFLQVSKEEILQYCREESIAFHEDASNRDQAFFRAWTRMTVFPMLEERYPGLKEVLARYAESANAGGAGGEEGFQMENLIQALTGPLNRTQRKRIGEMLHDFKVGASLSLSNGAQLKRLKNGWIIENDDQGNQA
jgi:tRNA(Ile)-lysidine synthase TilS/MesJ